MYFDKASLGHSTRPIGETYNGDAHGQAALLAGFGASLATVTLFLFIGALALPATAFA